MKHWPFEIVEAGKKPKIQVEFKCEKKTFTPEEVSSMVRLKAIFLFLNDNFIGYLKKWTLNFYFKVL
jgi:hypothetical protein